MKPKTPKEEGLLDYKKFCDINSALDTALKKQAEEIKKLLCLTRECCGTHGKGNCLCDNCRKINNKIN